MSIMANISIDFDPSKNEIYLLGDIKALQKHRFAWRYARDYLNPTIEAERIVIPVGDNEPYVVMSNISSMLAKYGFIEDQSKSTEQVVIDYYEEERRFKEFSEKALNIRNNECDTEEFAEFTKSVAENLPSRSLYPLQLLSAYHMAFSQNACNFRSLERERQALYMELMLIYTTCPKIIRSMLISSLLLGH